MTKIERAAYLIFVFGWILAPIIVGDLLNAKEVKLPKDWGIFGTVIWFAIGSVQFLWADRNKPKQPKRGKISYTDKGEDDWMPL